MGQAKKRGTFEQRKAEAIARKEAIEASIRTALATGQPQPAVAKPERPFGAKTNAELIGLISMLSMAGPLPRR